MGKSKIDWCDYVWNPVTGCSKVSEGCRNCYAERLAKRFWGERKFTDVICHEDRLEYPFSIKKPSRIFVNSMSDLFHEKVSTEFIYKVIRVMLNNPQHQFIVLTKRPERMRADVNWMFVYDFPNIIWGVSIEDQKTADERIPFLLETKPLLKSRHLTVSAEPLLGPVDIQKYLYEIEWVICGGESGIGARPMHIDWVTSLQRQCGLTSTAFFFKQWGEFDANGVRVGKAAAGHLLNGQEYHEYPRGFLMGEVEP